MKFLLSLILLLILFSCKKESGKDFKTPSIDKDSIKFFLTYIENDSTNNETKVKYSNKLFDYFKTKNIIDSSYKKLGTISEIYYKSNETEKLKQSSLLFLKNSIKNKDSLSISKAYNLTGKYYSDIGLNDSAFFYFVKAEKILVRTNDTIALAKNYLNKSKIQLDENDYTSSINNSFTALRYLKKSNLIKELYNNYSLIAAASDELNEHENSIFYYNKALELVSKNASKFDENLFLYSSLNNNIGFVYQNLNKHEEAIKFFKKALIEKNLYTESPYLYSMIIDNLAYSKMKVNDFNELPGLFYKALKIRRENRLVTGMIINEIHLSEYFALKKDTVQATHYSLEALSKAEKNKSSGDILLALKQATKVDKKNASIHSDKYINLSDSLQLEERKNKDRFARIELETDELRQANTQLSEQNRDILNYFAIAIVFGGFLFFARFQRLRARELALKQTQQQANEEIYRLIISHQNQLEEGRDLEKKRISKELHDGVLGRLFGLRLNLDGLNNFDDDETKQMRLDYLNELKVIEQDLREISHELSRENLVLINNFVAIINNLLEQQSKINKAKINTLISDKIDWENVSNTIKINLYRILQESLQNINKHAEAEKINVIFNKDSKGNLIFSVEDDGKGYNTNGKKTKGIGVNNIVERVHQCQGKIDIKSQIGKGTKIIITFPLENETINI